MDAPKKNEHRISFEVKAFLIDRQASGLKKRSVEFYQFQLNTLIKYLTSVHVFTMEELTTDTVRGFLIWHQERHSKGGTAAVMRGVKAFCNWFLQEQSRRGETWRFPLYHGIFKGPNQQAIPGVPVGDLKKMIATCERNRIGRRDKALLLFMLDTGLRRQELVDLDLGDINLDTGEVRVRHGKGDKARSVYMGNETRREVVRYLRDRQSVTDQGYTPLWVTRSGSRLTPTGLRDMLRRRAKAAGVDPPSPHDFRRAFALECLRNGIDPYSLARLMGHTTIKVLEVYLRETQDDLKREHGEHGPVDKM